MNSAGGAIDLIDGEVVNRWYKIGESYTCRLVYDVIDYVQRKYSISVRTVLDPFSGAGTTLVTSSFLGLNSHNIDINPFYCLVSEAKSLVWLYDRKEIIGALSSLLSKLSEVSKVLSPLRGERSAESFVKDYYDQAYARRVYPLVRKWIERDAFDRLVAVKAFAEGVVRSDEVRKLVYVAMAPLLHSVSRVTLRPGRFGSYKERGGGTDLNRVIASLIVRVNTVLSDVKLVEGVAAKTPPAIKVVNADSRYYALDEVVDLAVTSPPYPNDIEYVHQSRLELAFFNLVRSELDLTELRKRMVSSSVKYSFYRERVNRKYVADIEEVEDVARGIEEKLRGRNWGWDPANMVREYFGDMYLNLARVWESLRDGGAYVLVVGDSAYQNVKIPTIRILGKIAVNKVGFRRFEVKTLRYRRCTRHDVLLEESILFLFK